MEDYNGYSVGQIRLRNSAVLALVNTAATTMNIRNIISDFINSQAQKGIFNYEISLLTSWKRTDV
jgi:hypothetical protein